MGNHTTRAFTNLYDKSCTIVEYDDGKEIKRTEYNTKGYVYCIVEFDSNQFVTKETFYNDNGDISYVVNHDNSEKLKWLANGEI